MERHRDSWTLVDCYGNNKAAGQGGVLVSHKVPEGAEQRKEWKEKGGGGEEKYSVEKCVQMFYLSKTSNTTMYTPIHLNVLHSKSLFK